MVVVMVMEVLQMRNHVPSAGSFSFPSHATKVEFGTPALRDCDGHKLVVRGAIKMFQYYSSCEQTDFVFHCKGSC